MLYYLIVCRSLTFAQRTARVLERSGIPAQLLRTPEGLSERGCSYSVKLSERKLKEALLALNRAEMTPAHLYLTQGDGSYREVAL